MHKANTATKNAATKGMAKALRMKTSSVGTRQAFSGVPETALLRGLWDKRKQMNATLTRGRVL